MSGTDDEKPGGDVVSFPRVFMPGSFDAPAADDERQADDDQAPPVGAMPRLPGLASMAPPLALTMPGVPVPADVDQADDGDGGLVLPAPADPDNPTAQEVLATAMALVTALGVAAAQGMWHRARHRSALADQSRASADRSRAAAVGRTSRSAGTSGTSPSLLRSPSGGGKGRAFSRPTGHGSTGDKPTGHRSTGHDSTGRSRPSGVLTAHGPHRPPKRDKDKAAPKADRSGKPTSPKNELSKAKPSTPKGTPSAAGKPKPTSSAAPPKLRWKAPKGSTEAKGPKHWTGRDVPTAKAKKATPSTTKAKGKPSTPKGKATPPKSARTSSTKRKRWTGSGSSTRTSHGKHKASSPPPPPGWEGMRPPPGGDQTTWITVERVDHHAQQSERLALTEGPRALTAPAKTTSTQYADAELTIHDVIDAAADMAAEITDGVTEAQKTAEGCDLLLYRLEALHAKVVELRVPGVLEGLVVALMEQTGVVKGLAEGIAANLPRAAEAISIAGSNAEARHRPLADAVRDAGHIRPAERQYHED